MPTPVTLTDEQAALIWSGQSVDLANSQATQNENREENVEDVTLESVVVKPKEDEDGETKSKLPIDGSKITSLFSDEETEDDDEPAPAAAQENTQEGKKGRKPSDLVSVVNQLVSDEVLFGFEDGEIKTVDDVKDLIKLNLEQREKTSAEKIWKEKVNSYSPQVQAILYYAENGGQDLSSLVTAISNVEQLSNLTLDTPEGQEAIVKEALRMKGLDEEDIKEQVETLKDLDKIKARAEKYLPEINKQKQLEVQEMLVEQQERDRQAKEAGRIYLQTIESELKKDGFKSLPNAQKAKIFDSLATARYKSISGVDTNAFVKTLEDLQFGSNKNYERFLRIVQHVVDEESFMKSIEEKLQTKLAVDTVKKLKTAKQNSPNTDIDPVRNSGKKTISRGEFKNPFA